MERKKGQSNPWHPEWRLENPEAVYEMLRARIRAHKKITLGVVRLILDETGYGEAKRIVQRLIRHKVHRIYVQADLHKLEMSHRRQAKRIANQRKEILKEKAYINRILSGRFPVRDMEVGVDFALGKPVVVTKQIKEKGAVFAKAVVESRALKLGGADESKQRPGAPPAP